MKKYSITVNGVVYEVAVEELGEVASAPTAAPAPAAAPAPVATPKASAPAGAVTVKAPMPGTIIKVCVKVGDTVKKGDVLCLLEAMKMENDICAPSDGVIAGVAVSQGASVETDAVLVTMN